MTAPVRPLPAPREVSPAPTLTIRFGAASDAFPTGLPVIAGAECESLFPQAEPAERTPTFALFRTGAWLLGCGAAPASSSLEETTTRLYDELLVLTTGRHLCRIWNYVPAINALGPDGLENYRAFSRGRSLAFEHAAGPEFKRWLPAASAVGSANDRLTIVFAAHANQPIHRENPGQLPAYEYPQEHGPRAPSFARASVVPRPDGRRDIFISGTSAIKGHATVAPGDTRAQTHCTLENLRAMAHACDLGAECGADAGMRHVKVYLRHVADHPAVAQLLEREFLRASDVVSYVAADICRAALNVEIEVTVFGAGNK